MGENELYQIAFHFPAEEAGLLIYPDQDTLL